MSVLKSIIFETLPDAEEYYETAKALTDLERQYKHFTSTVWKALKQLLKFDEINRLVATEVEEKAASVKSSGSGKKLEKYERTWYRKNRDLVHLKPKFSKSEEAILESWI